jgi:hypothetical protein
MRVRGGEEVEGYLRGEDFLREGRLQQGGEAFLENAESCAGALFSWVFLNYVGRGGAILLPSFTVRSSGGLPEFWLCGSRGGMFECGDEPVNHTSGRILDVELTVAREQEFLRDVV